MIEINELRRLAQAATPGPWHATKSVETNSWAVWSDTTRLMELRPTKTVDMYRVSNTATFIAAVNPATISELLDRLEAAEKAVTEAYQRGYATGQEESEKEREELRADKKALECEAVRLVEQADSVAADLVSAWKERDALRAKIERMEKQEPVAWLGRSPRDGLIEISMDKPAPSVMRDFNMSPTYAHPVAQPAPSVPDEVMRDALRYRFLRSARNIPISTKAARDPVVYDEAIDAAMLAAAPEVKP